MSESHVKVAPETAADHKWPQFNPNIAIAGGPRRSSLGDKGGFVRRPDLLPRSAVLRIFFLLALRLSLGSLFLVQPERLDDSSLGQDVQLFGERNHSKGRPVGVTEKAERGLRVFPARYDPLTVVIDLR